MNAAPYSPIVENEIRPAEIGELVPEFHFGSPEFHFLAPEFDFGAHEFHFGNPEFHIPAREFHFGSPELHFGNAEFHFPAREFEFGSPEFHFLSPEFHFGIAEFEFGGRFTPFAAALLPGDPEPREKESSPTYRFLGRVSVRVCRVGTAARLTKIPSAPPGRIPRSVFYKEKDMLRDTSFANRINQCDVAVQNIEELAPTIPGGEGHLAEIRQQVDALRTSQESIQLLRAKLTDLVILRQQQNKKAGAAFRLFAAAARSHYGFSNPLLESFNIRSEHRAKRGRKKKEVKPAPEV